MKCANKRDLIRAIDKSAEELHQRIDMHCYLMNAILEHRVGDERIKGLILSSHSYDQSRLKGAIKEAIEVLEHTKKAFKSRRLETLRKKLTQVLIESQ